MATIKSYTDISQSKTLSKILSLESADMHSEAIEIDSDMVFVVVCNLGDKNKSNYGSPIWSLAALRNLLPAGIKVNENTYLFESHNTFDKSWVYRYYNEDGTSYLYYNDINEIDVCYELILKLNELKIL